MLVANAKDRKIYFYDARNGQRTRTCKLDISGESLHLSSDGQFLLSDSSYAMTKDAEFCLGTIRFYTINGVRKKSGDTADTYPFAFVADANLITKRFFFLQMKSAGPPKYYSGYVGVLNTKTKIFEIGEDTHPLKKGEMAFPMGLTKYSKFSIDGRYLDVSPESGYPGVYEISSKQKLNSEDSDIATQFGTADKWNLSQGTDRFKGLYATSGNLNYFITDAPDVFTSAISRDGSFVAVAYRDYVTWTSRIEIFCRECESQ
ncbi:hypothetical protein PQR62_24780 [Herbaspirillum lusitanum]|uniref:Lipoprotein n=1 Tax=Herbaspirillum lusitanum TaxID=213312 RepID=A0ABW9AGC5_9BURK